MTKAVKPKLHQQMPYVIALVQATCPIIDYKFTDDTILLTVKLTMDNTKPDTMRTAPQLGFNRVGGRENKMVGDFM